MDEQHIPELKLEDETVPALTLDAQAPAAPELTLETRQETAPAVSEPKPVAGPYLSVLSPAEQKAVREFVDKIDLTNSAVVLQYGVGAQKNIAAFSESALSSVRTKDMGEVGDMISSLVVELQNFDAEEERKGLFGLFKKAGNSLDAMKTKYAKVETNVDRIAGELEKQQITLLKDIAVLDQMYDKNKKTGALSPRTAHSLNPVPFVVYDKSVRLKDGAFGLANVAGTVAQLLGIQAPDCWEEGMLAE